MPGESKNSMQCAEFETLLTDALDDSLTGPRLGSFEAHAKACPQCGPLFAEAQEGRRWLKSLVEVEAPANLVHNILAATSGVERARSIARPLPEDGEGLASGALSSGEPPPFVMLDC